MQKLKFPKNFLWGSATSAYQVEGGNKNSDWESFDRFDRLTAGRFRKRLPKAGRACDHYLRFEEDFDIAKSLNQNSHRFSIEWARIEPKKGKYDEKEMSHYRDVLKALHKRKITPLVTLHHFTNPLWLSASGGWENPSTVDSFVDYVKFVVEGFSDLCNFWVTINEPYVYVFEGYLYKRWPPEKRSIPAAIRVGRNLMKAHRRSYDVIHTIQKQAKVGVAHSMSYLKSPLSFSSVVGRWERSFVKKAGRQDFIGLNYYRAVGNTKGLETSDLGWAIYPEGLYRILMDLKTFKLPIYITENGIADEGDSRREAFIRDHLKWLHRAIEDGVDVRGYFHWSLLDNFEWAHGFGPRFGLVEVNYSNLERRVRKSARFYGKIARENSVEV